MNEAVGPISFTDPAQEESFQKPYSEATGTMIDGEVRKLVNAAFDRTFKLLSEKKDDIEKVAQLLLKNEVITREDMENLLGRRPFKEKTVYDEYVRRPSQVGYKVIRFHIILASSHGRRFQGITPPPFEDDIPPPAPPKA